MHEVSDSWQKTDWVEAEEDDESLLNNVRLVGQAWFRGHSSCEFSLRPGLYREGTKRYLAKQPTSPRPESDVEDYLFGELFGAPG